MARYEHLPIYKSIYDLNLYFFKLAKRFPKDIKYSLAREVEELLGNLLDQIIIANNRQDKVEPLEEGLLVVERIKFKNRLLHDLGITGLKNYEYLSKMIVEISKQIEKWLNWSKTR